METTKSFLLVTVAVHLLLSLFAEAADVWVTYPDRSRLISWDGGRTFVNDGTVTPSTITVDETTTFQTMAGFGASLTDSSAWLLHNKLTDSQRAAAMQSLFGSEDGNAGISYLRIPIGSTDMSLSHYTYDDGAPDPTLSRFSISHDEPYILPIARQAKTISSNLRYMCSPWSGPAWMKSSNSLYYGKLEYSNFQVYAKYFRKFYDAYKQNGVTCDTMTIQNEPLLEPRSYPGMKYEWYDELNFVRGNLQHTMNGTGVKLLTFDHNWDAGWYPQKVMNEDTGFYAGSAWHCYAGEVSAMSEMHRLYPQKAIYLTECSKTYADTNFGVNMKDYMQKLFIGGPKNWAKTVMVWALATDPTGNPRTGGCPNCRGVITIDQSSGQVTFNSEFYAIAHLARFVWPGAKRIGSVDSKDGKFIGVAFKNTNGQKALVVLNQGSGTGTFKVVWAGKSITQSLPASGVATVFWS